ncbi:zincin-like metallopeptidase toxin domain-containing protein [Hymenobacter edaphi]|nr:zincin-like metallopeptidase toxin domain-containing protein [Hymenobacter edaphi]
MDLHQFMVDNLKRAAFNSGSRTVYVLKGFTYFEIAHEVYHARHWHQIGEEHYSSLTDLEKETYVYDALMEKAHKLTAAEIADATSYINRVRKLHGHPPLP